MSKPIDLTGCRFGRWTVLHRVETSVSPNGHDEEVGKTINSSWYCRCDCGKEKVVAGRNLRSGASKSCGCLRDQKLIMANKLRAKGKEKGSESQDKTHGIGWYIEQSLVYERAYSRICQIINEVKADRNKDEEPDASYQIVLDGLSKLRDGFREKSDEFWEKADKLGDHYDSGYENLFRAIVVKAAQDYEEAICGLGCDSEKRLIEKFLPRRFTDSINRARPRFDAIVKERGKDIVAETQKIRNDNGDMRDGKVKCPLCGGSLYAAGPVENGLQKIKCTGCNLFSFVRIANGRK